MAKRISNTITFTEQKKILQIKEWYVATSYNKIILAQNAPQPSYIIDETVNINTIGVYYVIESGEHISKNLPDEYDPTAIYYRVENLWLDKSTAELKEFVNGSWNSYHLQFQDTVQQADAVNRYLWNYEEVIYSIGESEKSAPVIIGTYGSIQDIINYYAITTIPISPPIDKQLTGWESDFSNIQLSNYNKYIWNFEIIIYADGTTKQTEPAIIGVYGDSGEDAISFRIYSTDGLEFVDSVDDSEKIDKIELKLSVYKGSKPLTDDVQFTWKWYNPERKVIDDSVTSETSGEYWVLEDGIYVIKTLPEEYVDEEIYYILDPGYQVIDGYDGITNTVFTVNIDDEYAFADLKCEMEYNHETYIDHVMLKIKSDIYSANIKFFDGTNVFEKEHNYILGYIELYKNNKIEETIITTNHFSNIVVLDSDSGIIREYVIDQTVDGTSIGTYYTIKNGKYEPTILPESVFNENITYYTISPILIDGASPNDGDTSYFVYYDDSSKYKVILGRYDANNNEWYDVKHTLDSEKYSPQYVYSSNIDEIMNFNAFVATNDNVARTKDVNINVFMGYKYVVDGSVTLETVGEYWILNENMEYTRVVLTGSSDENNIYNPDREYYIKVPDDDTFIATTHATIIDLNDAIIGDEPPSNPHGGQLWLDTKENILKIFNEEKNEWRLSSKQQAGGAIYTSKPDVYQDGDLWIIESPGYYFAVAEDLIDAQTKGEYWVQDENENYIRKMLPEQYEPGITYFIAFQEGSLFQAIESSEKFNMSHWKNAMQSVTQVVNNITQYITFNPSSGLKIGQIDDNFYVNIDSTEMGFYDNTNKDEKAIKVVSIGNQTAHIKNATIEESANFDCPVSINSNVSECISMKSDFSGDLNESEFVFQIESNGSLSLIVR